MMPAVCDNSRTKRDSAYEQVKAAFSWCYLLLSFRSCVAACEQPNTLPDYSNSPTAGIDLHQANSTSFKYVAFQVAGLLLKVEGFYKLRQSGRRLSALLPIRIRAQPAAALWGLLAFSQNHI